MRILTFLTLFACSDTSTSMLPPPTVPSISQSGTSDLASTSVIDPRWGGTFVQYPVGLPQRCVRIGERRFPTLDDAVNHAVDGDVIALCAGVFEADALVLERDISIRGAGPDRTVIRAAGSSFMHIDGAQGGALSLSNLRLAGPATSITVAQAALVMDNTVLSGIDGYAVTAQDASLTYIDVTAIDNDGAVHQTGGALEITGSSFRGHGQALTLIDTHSEIRLTRFTDNQAAIEIETGSIVQLASSELLSNGDACGGAICMGSFPSQLEVIRSDLGAGARDNEGHDVYLDAATGDSVVDDARRSSFTCTFEEDHGTCLR